jgi:SAM-dependent methyltransferase
VADPPQTWHRGIVARYWAEFNDDFRPHELPYFRHYVVEGGGAALDVGCGTGRLLLPYLREGLDVDGCDVSPDMVALCREKAERDGLTPRLWVQPMHELAPARTYRIIYACGSFGLGSTREQDEIALLRFYDSLEPGGTLLVDIEVPYADSHVWPLWAKSGRTELPEVARTPRERRLASDGSEYGLSVRVLALDPLAQRLTYEMRAERWRDGELVEEETRPLDINLYFAEELERMLERAGFAELEVQGDHNHLPATPDDDFVVLVARK